MIAKGSGYLASCQAIVANILCREAQHIAHSAIMLYRRLQLHGTPQAER